MRLRSAIPVASMFVVCATSLANAQTTKPPQVPPKPVPKTAPKAPPKTSAAPKNVTAPAKKPEVASPAPMDVHFTSKYTSGDEATESSTYIKGNRERYELGDMILLKQPDQKRTVQISRASNTYLVSADGAPSAPPGSANPAAAPRPPGVVTIVTTIVDTGERKAAFGHEARHVKTMIDRQPQPGACDPSKLRIETDGWYIDMPKAMSAPKGDDQSVPREGCADEIRSSQNGDPMSLGFPISYSTTLIEVDSKDTQPVVMTMEVTAFEVTKLDTAMFEIPKGLTAAMNAAELSKAVSDANELKLGASGLPSGVPPGKQPGVLRVGVPEVANKTSQTADTRALRTRLIAELEEQKVEAIPMAAASSEELQARAIELGVDYLLLAEITELKASKPGGLTRVMKTTSGEDANKDVTEVKMNVQLVAPGAKPMLSTKTGGKDGGMGFKTGLGIAKFAGSMYLKMATGGMFGGQMGLLNTMRVMNMGGMGILGNSAMMEMQSGLGGLRMGRGLDRTAGAANFIMNQAMMGAAAASSSQGGPSFDAALNDAVKDAGKKVVEALKKPVKK
ncbi:MAG: hypothetical protein ABIP90_03570 [Vicinamibacterales bacterium]